MDTLEVCVVVVAVVGNFCTAFAFFCEAWQEGYEQGRADALNERRGQ